MALSVGNRYLASEFIDLKARVKAEMQRRKYKGSLVTYASSSYDYTVVPTQNGAVLPEHVNKIAIPLNAINTTGVEEVASGDIIKAIDALDDFLTKAEKYSITSKTTDCKSTCTGLCVTGCGSGCTGCSGSCSGSCSGCSGCGGSCANGCGGVCSKDCISACDTTCQMQCKETCDNGCKNKCKGTCSVMCGNTCTVSCEGTCRNTCKGTCSGTCAITATD